MTSQSEEHVTDKSEERVTGLVRVTTMEFEVVQPQPTPQPQDTQYLRLMLENLTNRMAELESKLETRPAQDERTDSILVVSGYVGGVKLVALGIITTSVFPLIVGAASAALAMIHSIRMDELRGKRRR